MKDSLQQRSTIIRLFFMIGAVLLLWKALQIQLLDTSYQDKARATAIDKYVIYPSRGLMFDRNNKLMVNNNAMYDLKVTYKQLSEDMDTLKICELLEIDRKTFEENLNKNFRSRRYSKSVPFVFLSKVPANICARFMEHLHEFPGFSVQLRNVRGYSHRNAAHVLGYLNEVDQAKIDENAGKYTRGDYIGVTGLEAYYEDALRGKKGVRYVMKDNLGRVVGSYKSGELDSAAISGEDLITTLDLDLQRYAEQLLNNKTGSIVAIEPSSGEVLCMASAPTYDPNLLTINRNRGSAFSQLQKDSLRPFFDRSISAKYPPGSIFKTVVGLVALQEGILNPNRGITCNMGYYYNGMVRKCHSHPYAANIQTGLAHSCNAYFFQVLRDLVDRYGFYNPHQGLDTLVRYLYDFGLGDRLGIDLAYEVGGNIPTTEYYDYLYPKAKGGWYSPTIMSIGIGQGEIQMTTLQMANLAALIANRGWYYTPHLVKGFRNSDRQIEEKFRTRHQVPVDPIHFGPTVDGMEKAILEGTGRVARLADVSVCGKTGTSQNPHGKDHSVFFAFAPKENPKIAVAVYVEHGVWGATYAAPMASLLIEQYLKGEIDPSRQYLENRMLEADLISSNPP
ncbi:MAG: penicillin-binding protein 2 [Bacteroidota bacterium]